LLPSHIPVEKFKRVVVVAISQNPDLFKADRRSLFTAAQKCAADGLLPDGRQAALVVYGNQATYMPMVAGIRQRMRNSGEVLSAEAHVVYRNDKFFRKLGDDPAIVHEPTSFRHGSRRCRWRLRHH
jgi:recombination protein RecT